MNLPFSIRNDLGESEFLSLEGFRMTKYSVLSKPVSGLMECAGLDIPESVVKPVQASLVIKAGKDVSFVSGDYIIHPQWSGSTVKIHGQEYLIMKEAEVFGVFKKDPREVTDEKEWFVPLHDDVLLLWEEARDKFDGTDLVRPEKYRESYFTGQVIEVGPECRDVRAGTRVFWKQFSKPEKLMFFGKRFALLNEKDVYCEVPMRESIEVA